MGVTWSQIDELTQRSFLICFDLSPQMGRVCLGVLYQARLVLGRRTRCVNDQIVSLMVPFIFTHYLSNCLPEGETDHREGLGV